MAKKNKLKNLPETYKYGIFGALAGALIGYILFVFGTFIGVPVTVSSIPLIFLIVFGYLLMNGIVDKKSRVYILIIGCVTLLIALYSSYAVYVSNGNIITYEFDYFIHFITKTLPKSIFASSTQLFAFLLEVLIGLGVVFLITFVFFRKSLTTKSDEDILDEDNIKEGTSNSIF